jgi:hypothetical protein
MANNKFFWLAGALAIVLLAVGTYGTTTVFANGNNPPHPLGQRGPGGHGVRSLDSASLAAVASVLNMSTDDLSAALQNGQTLQELADAASVDMQAVTDALNSVRQTEMRDRINQALTDGTITQDKANWLLEGLDKGYLDGPGFGFGFGLGGRSWKGTPPATATPTTGGA